MKLLFTTTGTTGHTELKSLLGFINADLKLDNLIPDLITATYDVIDLVGKEVYDKAVKAYGEETISDENKAFLFAIRYPIAINAYRLFAPSNDIAHTNNGRKTNQDEHQKQPFQWMIDEDNAALEKRYYRALDDLIRFLDNSKLEVNEDNSLYSTWISSSSFQSTHDLFIRTTADFDKYFPLKSKLLLLKLAPGISDCEEYEIRPRIGQEKITALKKVLKENTPIDDEKDKELIRLIQKASVAYSFAWAMPRLSVQLYPEGVLQHAISNTATTRGAKPAMKSEIQEAAQAWKLDYERVLTEIENAIAPPKIVQEVALPSQDTNDHFISL